MKINLEGKSPYFKTVLLSMLRSPSAKKDPRWIKAYIQYADESASIRDPCTIISLTAIDGQISLRHDLHSGNIRVCCNCPDYGKSTPRSDVIKLINNQNLTPLLKPFWRKASSGIYSEITAIWLCSKRLVLKNHDDKFAFGRGFDYFELQT